jgi:hypothetical protein
MFFFLLSGLEKELRQKREWQCASRAMGRKFQRFAASFAALWWRPTNPDMDGTGKHKKEKNVDLTCQFGVAIVLLCLL